MPLLVIRGTAIFAGGVALFHLAFASAAAPSGEPMRLGLRGLKRARALAEFKLWSSLEPLARWIGRRARGWLSESRSRAIDRKIELAGDFLGLVPEEFVGLSAITASAGALLGTLLGQLSGFGTWATIGGMAYGAAAPWLVLGNASLGRLKNISRRLPHVIDLLSLAVNAGLDFPGAIRQVIDKTAGASDPLIEELSLVLHSLSLGRTRQQALAELARRAPCDSIVEFVGAVVQAELRGTPVADVLLIQAGVARRGRSHRAEEVAAKAGVKLLIPLAIIFICVLTLVVAPIALKVSAADH